MTLTTSSVMCLRWLKPACAHTHIIEILTVPQWADLRGLFCGPCGVLRVGPGESEVADLRRPRKALSTCAAHLNGSHSFWDTASSSIPCHPPASQRTRWCLCFSPLSHPCWTLSSTLFGMKTWKCLEQVNGEGEGKRKQMIMSKPLWCLVPKIKKKWFSKDMCYKQHWSTIWLETLIFPVQ